MTDAEEPRLRQVERDGIAVEKSIEEDRFPVPAIQFVIRSDREDETEIRLTDQIPDDVPMDHIGFHPDFESDHWTAFSDHRVRFERRLEQGEEIETVYGIRDGEAVDPDAFLTEPEVEATDSEEAIMGLGGADIEDLLADGVPDEADQLVGDLVGGDNGDQSGTARPEAGDTEPDNGQADPFEAAMTGGEDDVLGDVDMTEPDRESFAEIPESDAMESDLADESPAAPSPPEGVDVAAALLEALRDDAIDESVREALRAELGDGTADSPSMEVRLKHVQSRVEDLAAYTDALEAFIDEEGTASVIERQRNELADLEETVSELADEIDRERSARRELADQVASDDETVEAVAALKDDVSDLTSAVEALDDRVESNTTDVTTTTEDVAAIRSEVRALSEDVAELSTRADDTADLTEELTALESTLEDVDNRVEELQSWREHVTDVFGS